MNDSVNQLSPSTGGFSVISIYQWQAEASQVTSTKTKTFVQRKVSIDAKRFLMEPSMALKTFI